MEFSLISCKHNIEILVHGDLVIYVINFLTEDFHLVKDVLEEWIDHHI